MFRLRFERETSFYQSRRAQQGRPPAGYIGSELGCNARLPAIAQSDGTSERTYHVLEATPSVATRETGRDVRMAARGGFDGLTVGRARGYRQANLVIVPADVSDEFLGFCYANPSSCPVLGYGAIGSPALEELGAGIDVRTDLPRYEIYRGGRPEVVRNIASQWQDDFVAIALGCWFGAEGALNDAGIRMRHVELGIQGPLFRTTIPAAPYGRFDSDLVVSMRPFQTKDVPRVTAITEQLPLSHGAPLDFSSPDELGIRDASSPDWGEPLLPQSGETALFFGCGLTGTAALLHARVDFFITHAPGSMLVTDCLEDVAA